MNPMTSNHGGRVIDQDASTVEKKVFQMVPISLSDHIGVIYTI